MHATERSRSTAVIVINQNGRRHLETCFSSLRANTPPETALVLLDNASTDGSVEFVRARYPGVRILKNVENKGFAGGYDEAIRGMDRPFIVLLNNDTEVTEHWLEPLLAAAQADDVAACGARLVCMSDRRTVDHAGGWISVGGGGIDLEKGKYAEPRTTPFPTGFGCGACLLVKRDVFLSLGGFDPAYVIYHEDVDFCWRAWRAGFRVLHVPQSVIYHEGGAAMGHYESPRRVFLGQKNRLSNLVKNSGFRMLVEGLLVSAVFDLVRMVKWGLTFRWNLCLALCKADLFLLLELPRLLPMRRAFRRTRRVVPDRTLRRLGLIAGPVRSLRAYLGR